MQGTGTLSILEGRNLLIQLEGSFLNYRVLPYSTLPSLDSTLFPPQEHEHGALPDVMLHPCFLLLLEGSSLHVLGSLRA